MNAFEDPSFWAYVSIAHLWNFITWRQEGAFSLKNDGDPKEELVRYISGKQPAHCVPTRMYLRIVSLGGLQENYPLAYAVKGGTDLWHSHILRVRIGEYPRLVKAIIQRQSEKSTYLNRDPLRGFAKSLNRSITNLVPDMLDAVESEKVVQELWDQHLALPDSNS